MSSEALKKLDQIENFEKRKKWIWISIPSLIFVIAMLYTLPMSSTVEEGEIIAVLPIYAKATRQNGICKVRLQSAKEINAVCKVGSHKIGSTVKVSTAKSSLFSAPKNTVLNGVP